MSGEDGGLGGEGGLRHPARWYTAEGGAAPNRLDRVRSLLHGTSELPEEGLRRILGPALKEAEITRTIGALQAEGAYDPASKVVDVAKFLRWVEGGSKDAVAVAAASLPPRPGSAHGEFLRIVTLNDNYKLSRLPNVAMAIRAAKSAAADVGCVVKSTMNGDFLSPCLITAIDGGAAMMAAMDVVGVDYLGLGNHEFDIGVKNLAKQLRCLQRGKVLNSNVNNPELAGHPKWDSFKVGHRTVVVGGFLSDDTSIYSPTNTPDVTAVNEAAIATWDAAKAALGLTPDLFVPLTHQLTPQDKDTAKFLAKHEELCSRTPVLLAGHDHEMFVDEAGRSAVVKVGLDCENLGIVDIWWTATGQLRRRILVLPSDDFAPCVPVSVFTSEKQAFVDELMSAPIATLDAPMSSRRVRFEKSGIATFLLSLAKRDLESEGVEAVLLQGGAVRANTDYQPGPLLMGDLFKELAFETEQAIIKVPGRILAESILNTRSAPKPAPNFLHCDDGVVVTDGHVVTHINGEPFDPERIYTVSLYHALLTGLNVIEPLYSYALANCRIPTLEECMPIKDVVLRRCMKIAWRDLVGIDPRAGSAELDAKIEETVAALDTSGDGFLDHSELASYAARKTSDKAVGKLLDQMIKALDVNGDGKIDAQELRAIAR